MTNQTTKSKTVAGRLFDLQMAVDYETTIARLRAANKKLRAELAESKTSIQCGQRVIDRLAAEGEMLERVVEMFAKAIGGKAK